MCEREILMGAMKVVCESSSKPVKGERLASEEFNVNLEV